MKSSPFGVDMKYISLVVGSILVLAVACAFGAATIPIITSWVIPEPEPVEGVPYQFPECGGSFGDPDVSPIPLIPSWATAVLPFEPFDMGEMFHWEDGGAWYVDPPVLPEPTPITPSWVTAEKTMSRVPGSPPWANWGFMILDPNGAPADMPVTCASCENWTPDPGVQPYIKPEPAPNPGYADYLPGCGNCSPQPASTMSVEELIASYMTPTLSLEELLHQSGIHVINGSEQYYCCEPHRGGTPDTIGSRDPTISVDELIHNGRILPTVPPLIPSWATLWSMTTLDHIF